VNKKVVEKSVSTAARLISLKEIREKLFKKQEDMGLIGQVEKQDTRGYRNGDGHKHECGSGHSSGIM